jgi:hypothetical protein
LIQFNLFLPNWNLAFSDIVTLKVCLSGSVGRRSSIQKMQVDRNAESDPILGKDIDLNLDLDPKKSDRSEACPSSYLPSASCF